MGFSILFLMFGLAALMALSSDSSDEMSDDTETPPVDDDEDSGSTTPPDSNEPTLEEQELERIRLTGQGNDNDNLIVAREGVMVYSGLGGNDTLVGSFDASVMMLGGEGDDVIFAFGGDMARGGVGNDLLRGDHLTTTPDPQTLNGGPGNDTIITHGASEMTGGDGQDVFILSPMGIDPASGAFLSASNTPLAVPVITDFNAAEDVLVLDLIQSFDRLLQAQAGSVPSYTDEREAPDFGDDVVIGVQQILGGTLVSVNNLPFAVVQGLSPDQLANDGVLQVNGAVYTLSVMPVAA
jgi:Ca2+-binding RTX toxin-like protein